VELGLGYWSCSACLERDTSGYRRGLENPAWFRSCSASCTRSLRNLMGCDPVECVLWVDVLIDAVLCDTFLVFWLADSPFQVNMSFSVVL
jgi:hypothetical protein